MNDTSHSAVTEPPDASPFRLRLTFRGLRLASGLTLLAYVLTHLTNHALGNVSLAAMEWGLGWAGSVWWSPPGQAALYGGFSVHLMLGLLALYRRRPFRYRLSEGVQLVFGLLIPALLLQHIVATRGAYILYGTDKRFAQLLSKYFVDTPAFGILQVVTLTIVWVHACLGIYFWLRLKPLYPRVAPALACVALLVPILAVLGVVQGGRQVIELFSDPAWRALHVGPAQVGTPAENAELARIRDMLLLGYGAAVLLTLAARGVRSLVERRRGLLSFTYPNQRLVRVPAGTSVLEASRLARIPHASICGGRGRCSTCRVRVVGRLPHAPPPSDAEQAVLDRVRAGTGVRLACQFRPASDVVVSPLMAAGITLSELRDLDPAAFGEERFVVAMFVDMRGSTRLAENRLPYDTVFVINRFLEAVGGAVAESGGVANQFLGDGLMALFGLRNRPGEAARQGLEAIGQIAAAVARLNRTLAQNLEEPIRFGIGLHAGTAILGEIGDRQHGRAVFTAIGDPVNVASRLQGMTKRLKVEALVSEAVFEAAGIEPDLPREHLAIEGRDGQLWVRPLASAAVHIRTSAFEDA